MTKIFILHDNQRGENKSEMEVSLNLTTVLSPGEAA